MRRQRLTLVLFVTLIPYVYALSTIVPTLLSDLTTPCLLVELDLVERKDTDLLKALNEEPSLLQDCLFVHTKVTSTEQRDNYVKEHGSGQTRYIAQVDAPIDLEAYLGIGLANHHVGGYYWARGMGIGASLPAHGVEYGRWPEDEVSEDGSGHLFWKKRGPGIDASAPTEDSSNSNDGKRSEWVDFIRVGDTVQLVPFDSASVLDCKLFSQLIGVRRTGRPRGSDPIVDMVWKRVDSEWRRQEEKVT